jgi:carbamoyltransferase
MSYENPYMLYVAKVKNEKYPAITHIDNTCRIQTVSQNSNTTLRQLLQQFHKLTNCPVLLNTSLNAAGKPIASWPENAEEEFNTSSIDVLVIGDKITLKT